ncbi:MAG: ABC transporter ATP-binding protein [Bacillota bacterium]
MKDAMIELNHVSKGFSGRPVLADLSFAVRPGEILGFLGPNGSGKTTTVRLMNGVIHPDGGQIRVNGYDPVHDGDAIRRMSGILTESAGFYLNMTGLENLRFYAQIYGVTDRRRPVELLEEFGLADAADRKVGAYSTGMKKRLGLAKALLHRPELLFLDEPTNGLDPEGIRMVLQYIKELNQRHGTTIILCSHLLQQLEVVCQRYVFLLGGRVIEQGTLPELEAKHNPTVTLEVETDLALADGEYRGVPVKRLDPSRLAFTLPGREAVPGLLRELSQEASVYSATPEGQDLEALYFKIRRAVSHE